MMKSLSLILRPGHDLGVESVLTSRQGPWTMDGLVRVAVPSWGVLGAPEQVGPLNERVRNYTGTVFQGGKPI